MKLNLFSLAFLLFPFLFAPFQPAETSASSGFEQPQACNLAAPSWIDAPLINNNMAELSWSAVSGAYAYALVVTDNGSPFLQTTVFGTTISLMGLKSGHTYHCTVASMCDGSQTNNFIIMMDINP